MANNHKGAVFRSEETIPAWAIGNFPALRAWMGASYDRNTALSASRPRLLTTILGPSKGTATLGSQQLPSTLWRVDADGVPVWVLCSSRGTNYAIEHPNSPWDGGIPDVVIVKVRGFLARLFLRMEALDPIERVERIGPTLDITADPVLAMAAARIAAEDAGADR